MTSGSKTVTILFTDLVGSTELLQRAGDEQAQRILKAHHRLLSEAVRQHGGHEVKWLGDGLMVAFDSAQEAVKCAIAMQQGSRRPAAGERLEIRAGLNAGEAFVDESDYFGTAVVVARRLCDKGDAGQILASDVVVRLLDGRGADIHTKELGPLELKGITAAVPAVEIVYEQNPMTLLRKLPFVGRQQEFQTLLRRLAEAHNGRGSVVLLAGEPGIGKTRLTEEFCEHASSSATVIRGDCYEGDVAAPFGPWLEPLRSLVSQTPDGQLGGLLGERAAVIATLLPELRGMVPAIEQPPKIEPEAERARMFQAILSLLQSTAERRPLVMVLDDLHWADKASLLLLEHVARALPESRILIVGAYRDVEVDRVHPLAQTLAALRRMEHSERLAIRSFDTRSVSELLSAIEPSPEGLPASTALATLLVDEADGNPFFIHEILNNLVETGKLAFRDGAWSASVESIQEMEVPEGAKELIGRRLSRLSEGCNRMLQRASIMTNGFSWDELRAAGDESEDVLLDYLDEALGSHLLTEQGHLAYTFTHALIRTTLYEELSGPRRVVLHRRVAESLEELYAGDIESHLGELAAHYLASAGGEAQKAVEYSIRAGDRAMEVLAWEEAVGHYQRALEAMHITNAPYVEERCRVLLNMADCDRFCGALGDTILDHLRQAAALARQIPSSHLLALAATKFETAADREEADLSGERLALLDEASTMLGAEDSAEKALVMAFRTRAAAAAANARAGLPTSGFMAWAGTKEEAVLSQAREALEMAKRVGERRVVILASYFYHSYAWLPDNNTERLQVMDEARAIARETNEAYLEVDILGARAADLLALGDLAAFRQNRDDFVELIERVGYVAQRFLVAAMEVGLATAEGRLDLAEQRIAEVSDGTPTGTVVSVGDLFFLRLHQGRLAELEGMWAAIVQQPPGMHIMRAGLTLIRSACGKADEAAADLDRLAREDFGGIPRDFLWTPTLTMLAEACAGAGHRTSADALYTALLPHMSENAAIAQIVSLGSIARAHGRLATVLEHYDEAEKHYEMAIAANERMGFHAWTAWTRLNYGEMLLRRGRPGDRAQAVALLTGARSFAMEAGMGKVERDSERLLAEAGGPK
jgi:class 3 adenylate cyclase/tetratricopeptide (TPR) repeat protein